MLYGMGGKIFYETNTELLSGASTFQSTSSVNVEQPPNAQAPAPIIDLLKFIKYLLSAYVGAKYAKKLSILGYDAGLIDAINLCVCEDKRRSDIPEHQWNKYASLLGDECEERLTEDSEGSLKHAYSCVQCEMFLKEQRIRHLISPI
ncbi:unnamed protein product [Microthlaspi erraticum]|uniref:DUF629 domain-containing protein n=1 Tax=Microthlaspi erraticum TaxID=1685480 RepID=A0A6D2IM50_9BRAS|nr:unnamed protein product [Microthlaspi erraticum]